jgi:hypothetical protein
MVVAVPPRFGVTADGEARQGNLHALCPDSSSLTNKTAALISQSGFFTE